MYEATFHFVIFRKLMQRKNFKRQALICYQILNFLLGKILKRKINYNYIY